MTFNIEKYIIYLSVANATVTTGSTSDGNDIWTRGMDTSTNRVISKYKNYGLQGRASTINGNGVYKDGGWKAVNVFSDGSQNPAVGTDSHTMRIDKINSLRMDNI